MLLSKTIKLAEKIYQVGSSKSYNRILYSETKKNENFLNKKIVKITKRAHDFKWYASSYNVEILNSYNPELKLKDTESGIKNKLTECCLSVKVLKSDDKTLNSTFYSNLKAETIINESDIDDVFKSIYITTIP